MLKKIIFFGALLFCVIASIIIIANINSNIYKVQSESSLKNSSPRIVSFSPSITEYLYALDLDSYLIANTSYCNYPEDAKNKKKVGDFLNINYEYLLSLNINTAILQQGMEKQMDELNSYGINTIMIDNSNIENILNAFDILGKAFSIEERAKALREKVENDINSIKSKINFNENKPKVLISVFRDFSSKNITNFTAAGSNNLYDDILKLLNAQNALDTKVIYPEISREGVFNANPDIIIDITHNDKGINNLNNAWLEFKSVNAVKNSRIYLLDENSVSIPGPRITEIIRSFFLSIYDE